MSDTPPPPIITGGASGPAPIGVPDGYASPNAAGNVGWGSMAPRYTDGDQFQGANRNPGDIANLQRALAAARLLSGGFRIGTWDDATAAAFEALLAYANQTGLEWQRALQRLQGAVATVDEDGNVIPGAGGGGAGGGLPVRVSDPATLRNTFREVASAMRGQALSDGEYDQMVAAYQAVERRAQEREYDLSQGAVGDERYEIMNPPDAQTWAEDEVRRRDPSGVMGRDTLDRMDQFYALIQQGAPVQPSGR
jgi:hypothetical protein